MHTVTCSLLCIVWEWPIKDLPSIHVLCLCLTTMFQWWIAEAGCQGGQIGTIHYISWSLGGPCPLDSPPPSAACPPKPKIYSYRHDYAPGLSLLVCDYMCELVIWMIWIFGRIEWNRYQKGRNCRERQGPWVMIACDIVICIACTCFSKIYIYTEYWTVEKETRKKGKIERLWERKIWGFKH